MKQIIEFIPILLFFIVYAFNGETISLFGMSFTIDGIYSATLIMLIAYCLIVLVEYIRHRTVEKRMLWTFLIALVLGSLTLVFHNKEFIQWKPTLVNWGFSLGILIPRLMNRRSWVQVAIGSTLTVPVEIWRKLDLTWMVYFFVVGALNLVVAYQFTEAQWVDYKMYSAVGFTVFITIVTAFILAPHIQTDEEDQKED